MTYLTQTELIANMEATAERLTGIPVTVRIVEHPGAYGLTRKDYAGRCVVDFDPAIFADAAKFASTFTHEIAHVKKHFHALARTDVNKAYTVTDAAQHISQRKARPAGNVARAEDEAGELAARWMAIVRRHHAGYSIRLDPIMAVLNILYHRVND